MAYDEDLEFVVEVVSECLRVEGLEVIDFADTNTRTTAYKGVFVKDKNNKEYTISFNFKWTDREKVGF